jgi:hypothetical protein
MKRNNFLTAECIIVGKIEANFELLFPEARDKMI